MSLAQYDDAVDTYDSAVDSYDGGATGLPIGDPRYTITMAAPDRTLTAAARTWQVVVT